MINKPAIGVPPSNNPHRIIESARLRGIGDEPVEPAHLFTNSDGVAVLGFREVNGTLRP